MNILLVFFALPLATIILAAIFVGLIVIVTTAIFLLPRMLEKKQNQIPDVAGLTVKQAIAKLGDEGFDVNDEQMEISSADVPEGKVVKSNPEAGSKRTKGTKVTLYISTGDSQHEISDYNGRNYLEVKGELEAYNIIVIIEKREVKESDNAKENLVMDQDVKAGEKLRAGDTITLYIPNITVKYPDFTDGNYTVEKVQAFCDTYGVTLKVLQDETSSYNEGAIFYQSRPKGYTVTEGTTLTIKTAKKPENSPDTPVNPDGGDGGSGEDNGGCEDGLC